MRQHPAEPKQINLCTEAEMSGSNLAVLAHRNFPKWPKSVKEDQAAIEQARRELGPDADAKQILARAQKIKERGKQKQAITAAWYQVQAALANPAAWYTLQAALAEKTA